MHAGEVQKNGEKWRRPPDLDPTPTQEEGTRNRRPKEQTIASGSGGTTTVYFDASFAVGVVGVGKEFSPFVI